MSEVHQASPGDVYVDKYNKLWRVVSTCHEPTVCMEEVEPEICGGLGVMQFSGLRSKAQKTGGMTGAMWEGFRRILPFKAEVR